MSTVVSKNIGQVFGMPLHWKPRVVMTPTLSSPRLSLWWQLAGTTVMTKLALRQFSILGISHSLVNIMITIAIHCHSQRFLDESESLSYYRVLNTLVRWQAVHNTRQVTLNMNQFLVTNGSQVCELCVIMFRNELFWFIQIHLDKPYCAAIELESTQWCKLDAAPFWHIIAYLRGCNIL